MSGDKDSIRQPLRVGVAGFGFMGRMHFAKWSCVPNVNVVAIWDVTAEKLQNSDKLPGNIENVPAHLNLSNVKFYSDYEKMLAETKLDVISIALPTFLHFEYSRKALLAGINVLCEKPMALSLKECDQLIKLVQGSGKKLMVGHCVRFWPEYVKLKDIVHSEKYGRVLAATFRRMCELPPWSQDKWALDVKRSGGAIMDLHIHDSDFIQYLFGCPDAVYSRGITGPSGGYDHVITNYFYSDEKIITAEGGWLAAPGFGFEISFDVVMEKVTVMYNSRKNPTFQIYPSQYDTLTAEITTDDAYFAEISHFAEIVSGSPKMQFITPEDSKNSVKLIEAERLSIEKGQQILL